MNWRKQLQITTHVHIVSYFFNEENNKHLDEIIPLSFFYTLLLTTLLIFFFLFTKLTWFYFNFIQMSKVLQISPKLTSGA